MENQQIHPENYSSDQPAVQSAAVVSQRAFAPEHPALASQSAPQNDFQPAERTPHLPSFMHHSEPASPPEPPQPPTLSAPSEGSLNQDDQPVAVVKTLSVRGLEYAMMSMTLWLASAALVVIVLLLVNGGNSFDILAFPISLLVVSTPIFGYLFLRLKRAELASPALRFDPSKRRLSQTTQLFTFVASLITMIGIVYIIIAKMGGAYHGSMGKTLLDLIIILLVSGGLFAYYWNDEHKRT